MLLYLLLLISLVLYWTWTSRRSCNEPPILKGSLPLIGHAYMLLGNSVDLWQKFKDLTHECLNKGHAFYFLIGAEKFYVLTDPDDIILVSNMCLQKDRMFNEMNKELIGEGLIFADVTTWKRHRKIILPTFNKQILDSYLPAFNTQATELVKKLETKCGNGLFNVANYLKQMTLQAVSLTSMGVQIDDDAALKYYNSFDLAVDRGIEKYQKFWLRYDFIYNLTDLKKEKEEYMKTIQAMSDFILATKRNELKMKGNNNCKEKRDFLDQLLHYCDELSEKEIADEVYTMLIAGTDTTSTVMLYALLLIGSFPNVQDKTLVELKNIFGNTGRNVEKEDLTKMIYLEAVLKETLRYYVMAPLLLRYIDKEVKLKNYTLQPGNNCLLSIYGVHRHNMWGYDADQFRPERWIENSSPSDPNSFIPFSIGKRNCIGRAHAMMLMKTTLSHLLRRYKIYADHTKLKIKLQILIKPESGHYISIENNNSN